MPEINLAFLDFWDGPKNLTFKYLYALQKSQKETISDEEMYQIALDAIIAQREI